MKFRRKPIEVEAIQWTGNNFDEIRVFVGVVYQIYLMSNKTTLGVVTLEGTMMASIGYWIIRGIKDEFHAVRPDIFKETYEEINSPTAGDFTDGE